MNGWMADLNLVMMMMMVRVKRMMKVKADD